MAYSVSDLSTNEQNWAAADKPFISNNALYNTSDDALFVRGSAFATTASSEDEDPDFPTESLFDGFPSLLAKPIATEQNFTIVLDRSSAPITFDWVGVINHNLYTLTCDSFRVDIADDGAFTTNLATIMDFDPSASLSSDRRFTDLALGSGVAKRYTDVPYIRIGIRVALSSTPQIGQIVLGRRRQQQFQPELPYDEQSYASKMHDFESDGGVINRVVRFKSRRELSVLFRHSTAAEQTDILSWWADIEGGQQPFFFVNQPGTSPMDFWMMMINGPTPRLNYPRVAHNTRDLTLDATEQGQAFFALE
jgi:hypothetical protein